MDRGIEVGTYTLNAVGFEEVQSSQIHFLKCEIW